MYDLVIKDNDLVAGTHGRAFWILDDVTPLRERSREVMDAQAHVFTIPVTYRLLGGGRGGGRGGRAMEPDAVQISGDGIALHELRGADGSVRRSYLNAGDNPPSGVVVTYYLKEKPQDEISLTILDAKNQVIRKFGSAGAEPGQRMPTEQGTNRFVWDMTYPGASEIPAAPFLPLEWAHAAAPVAPPGMYKVRLHAGGEDYDRPFEIRKDPRVEASQQDLEAQFAFMLQIRDKVSQVTGAVNEIRAVRARVEDVAKRIGAGSGMEPAREAAAKLRAQLLDIEGALTRLLGPNPMRLPPKTLNIKLASLTAVVQSADEAPVRQAYDVFEDLSAQVAAQLNALKALEDRAVPDLLKMVNRLCKLPVLAS